MKINLTLNRPKWLGDDVGCLYRTVTVTESTANYVVDNGRKIIPSGTLIVTPSVSGLLLNDCDVTDGERVAQILVRGGYIDSQLPTSVSTSKTLLSNQGLFAVKYAETVIPSGDNGGGNAGGGSGVSGDLTPFRVGQIIKGINFNSNLKPINGEKSTEMDNFLASLPYNDSNLYIFAEGILQDQDLDTEVAMVARKDNEQIYIFGNLVNNSHFIVAYSTGINGVTGQEGWQNITDGKAMLNDGVTILINRIPDNSNNWNGTLIGAVEA